LSIYSGSSVSLQQLRCANIRTSGGREEVRLNRSRTGGLKSLRFGSLTDQYWKSSLRRQTLRGREQFRRLQQVETNSEIVDARSDSIERGDVPSHGGISDVACRKSCMHFRYHSTSAPEQFILKLFARWWWLNTLEVELLFLQCSRVRQIAEAAVSQCGNSVPNLNRGSQ
jgi:hypothetical protein